MALTEERKNRLKALSEKYGLTKDDFFNFHGNPAITRTGIEKISAVENITVDYEVQALDVANKIAVVKATAEMAKPTGGHKVVQTFGESATYNTKNGYPVAMAEKRAFARAVLKLTEFYAIGIYSDSELDQPEK